MKTVWNSLLIALTLLLSNSASVVLAEPTTIEHTTPIEEPIATEPKKTPEELARYQKLVEADRLYLAGDRIAALNLYRQVKTPFAEISESQPKPEPILDPTQLAPAGQVYWREALAGIDQKLESRIFVPLQLLVERYPEFIPGHLQLAQALKERNRQEEALQVLEKACSLYPNQPDLLKAKIAAQAASENWLEASIAARQFALLNRDHPQSAEFTRLADENLKRYRSHLRSQLRGNAIASVLTGALSYALTGSIFGPISAVETIAILIQGEQAIGERIAKSAQRQLDLIKDPEVLHYINEVGQKLAKLSGRDDFEFEFYVVLDEDLNAFALPGGKIFVNAKAIIHSNSEAELAGLLAHEISHAVLSHAFQLLTQANAIDNVAVLIPRGGILSNLLTLNYSREMEQQADILGTRILAASGYAADGLRNLMVTLKKQQPEFPITFLSSHPDTDNRIRYLENLIQRNSYNRYAYEGVARHAEIQTKIRKLLRDYKQQSTQRRRHRN
ncbi:M48 family metallopeptidase [Microseira wollei]|uniref:Peptidase M48, Ste24p n=1 Tax=Microseira wollei NIES-4236 TaxID=2530354 RepID=A0AAV3XMI8_9CYAN|nr:M48 family metallopeptidase [Microseira wollei]GET41380.1 peptidase M48, Ste24p [Microseira wollei NIES-4236]